MNKWIRQTHRWLSIAFTLGVLVNFIVLGTGEPVPWVYGLALLPLALLWLSGMYLFVLPYLARRRGGADASRPAGG